MMGRTTMLVKTQRRKGFSMIETIAAVVILSLLVIVIGRISTSRLTNQDSIEAQYSVLAADAVLGDIYEDFHNALSYSFTESPAGQRMLVFTLKDGTSSVYSLNPTDDGFYKNGVFQFNATRFDVVGTGASMTISVKLVDERLLDYTVYR